MAELLSALLENLIYDITGSAIKNWFDKHRLNKFLRSLKADVSKLCQAQDYESIYVDSSAFDYFIRSTDFLKRVIERSISTRLEKSNKEFLRFCYLHNLFIKEDPNDFLSALMCYVCTEKKLNAENIDYSDIDFGDDDYSREIFFDTYDRLCCIHKD